MCIIISVRGNLINKTRRANTMKRRSTYHVKYMQDGVWSDTKGVDVIASSKAEAYDIAVYEKIPQIEGSCPWSAWVASVTYQNGNYHEFNTGSGNCC